MVVDLELVNRVIFLIGEITIIILLAVFFSALLLVALSYLSIRRGKIIFPGFLKAGLVLLEGLMKALFRLFGLEDREILTIFIQLQNTINKKAFEAVPIHERAIFMPQCLRSSACPAHLTPEGLKCRSCGACAIGGVHTLLESIGYRIFIVPGSSFIKRMVKKYRPKAIIGVGCLTEVKEGLDMADKMGLIAMGVVTLKEGCVETIVEWEDLFDVALLGVEPGRIPEDALRSAIPEKISGIQ
jgi:hypothetical protein